MVGSEIGNKVGSFKSKERSAMMIIFHLFIRHLITQWSDYQQNEIQTRAFITFLMNLMEFYCICF